MYIPGHLSVGYLFASAAVRSRGRGPMPGLEVLPVLLGTLTPDLVDKTLYFTGLMPHSRGIGHSFFVLVAMTVIWIAFHRGKRAPATVFGFWLLGVVAHSVADVVNDLFRGLFHSGKLADSWFLWPLKTPDDWKWVIEKGIYPDSYFYLMLEAFVVMLALVLVFSHRKDRFHKKGSNVNDL